MTIVNQIQARLRANMTMVLLVFVIGGFLLLLAELLLTGHTKGIQAIAIASTIAGVLLGLGGLFARPFLRKVLIGLFLLLALSGVVGIIEHNEERFEGIETNRGSQFQFIRNTLSDEENERFEHEEYEEEEEAPPLAPLSLSGLATLGAVTLFAAEDKPKKL